MDIIRSECVRNCNESFIKNMPLRLEGFTHLLEGLLRLEGSTQLLEGFTHILEGFTHN